MSRRDDYSHSGQGGNENQNHYSPTNNGPQSPFNQEVDEDYDNFSDYTPQMHSPYHSSQSSGAVSPRFDQPVSPNQALHPDQIKSGRATDSYYSNSPYSDSGMNSARSSLMPSSNQNSDIDVYSSLGNPKLSDSRYAAYAPSTESLLALIESKKPNFASQSVSSFSRASSWVSEANGDTDYFDLPPHRSLAKDYPWPAWSMENQVPITKEEIWDIFEDLSNRFGFQKSSIRNQYDAMMTMLDSRSSRMTPTMALLTLHADYIGGPNSNFRKWYFATEFNKDSLIGSTKAGYDTEIEEQAMADSLEEWWRNKMSRLSTVDKIRQIALYLCIWGEALNVRYLPEMICFIYKIADDYFVATEHSPVMTPEGEYLDKIIQPIYEYIRDQNYEVVNGQFLKREKDHAQVIGYDDINETFWSRDNLERLVLQDKKTQLMSFSPGERYPKLCEVSWKHSIKKTYFERRTWLHIVTNFSRVWIFHFSVFFMFWIMNSQFLFTTYEGYKKARKIDGQELGTFEDQYLPQVLSLVGFGGAIASGIAMWGTFCEFFFVERSWFKYKILIRRYLFLLVLFLLCVIPTGVVFFLGNSEDKTRTKSSNSNKARRADTTGTKTNSTSFFTPKSLEYNNNSQINLIIAVIHMIFGILVTITLTIIPPANLFNRIPSLTLKNSSKPGLINRSFTADYATLDGSGRATSLSMWGVIFVCKLVESYVSLIWSFKSAFRVVVYLNMSACTDGLLGSANTGFNSASLCHLHQILTMFFMVMLLLIMFFLDTYLWYIIITSIFSIANAFQMGISVLSPWKNIFGMMPKRIYTKILATSNMEIKLRPKMLCSQVWNAVVISMYRDHLISIDHVQKLLYQQVASDIEGKKKLKPPTFFVAQEDTGLNTEFFPPGSEAERRISFFASSLSTVIPEPLPVENMPTFTVFTPHYAEKILLSLREIIREDDQYTRVTLLEYLKSLYKVEWDNFVKDTKILAEENAIMSDEPPVFADPEDDKEGKKIRSEDLPFYCIGFKSAAPEFTLRTRIWASLRSQTLYRTISGFMNYSKALKLLHRIENPELVHILGGNTDALEMELDLMARRKFNFLISMQRYTKFNKEEKENVEFLFKSYPDLQVAYLEDVPSEVEGAPPTMFSCLIDGHCELDEKNNRIPRYRVRIPGNPILGDGKSDNQNHAVIFTRGEYLQVIDANQDNYLEEALKIRSVLAEFEEYHPPPHSPYSPPSHLDEAKKPVAIIGAREYIFSENIGILGDIAAGKEATFGTLTHRIMATVGGRLHYGHPDFLNMIFMNTRGGLSKAQKGLHLNEDIYAGMNAFQRGGRIKHSEYIQCGKGRDLGFCSVLNFNTKIGTGMGEQLLAREYYYLYTQLPLDRMLTLFYAHPGFHVNNMMIMFSIQAFMIVLAMCGVIASSQPLCKKSREGDNPTFNIEREDCFNFLGVTGWISRTILSVFFVLFITFLPLLMQVLAEQGFVRMASRFGKQVVSCAPMFEIFTTQIYSNAILSNMSFGGARYIGTGRGFATTRQPFATLYSRFASSSLYAGMRNAILLLFACLTPNMWQPAYLYFWFTICGMVISPWIFNPHQFSMSEFILDYRAFLRWMSKGNSLTAKDSWIAHCRYARTRITGQKRKRLGDKERKIGGHIPRANRLIIFASEVFLPFLAAIVMTLMYATLNAYDPKEVFNTSIDRKGALFETPTSAEKSFYESLPQIKGSSGFYKAALIALAPIGINAGVLVVLFPVSLFLGPILSMCSKSFGGYVAAVAHTFSVLGLVICSIILYALENFDLSRTVIGLTAAMFIQRFIFALLMFLFLTREFGHDGANCAWWTGKWMSAGLGWMAVTQPLREFVCKIIEMSLFATDFIIAHIILICLAPFTLVPFMDKWHSTMLFWLKPSRQIRAPIFSMRQKALRRRRVILFGILFIIIAVFFLAVVIAPTALRTMLLSSIGKELAKNDQLKQFKLVGDSKKFPIPQPSLSSNSTRE